MKKIIRYLILIFPIIVFTGCGGSGGTTEGSTIITAEKIIVINCDGSGAGLNDCANASIPNNYTCIKSADTLVANTNNTLLEIVDSSNGNKKVCVQTTSPMGAAHINR